MLSDRRQLLCALDRLRDDGLEIQIFLTWVIFQFVHNFSGRLMWGYCTISYMLGACVLYGIKASFANQKSIIWSSVKGEVASMRRLSLFCTLLTRRETVCFSRSTRLASDWTAFVSSSPFSQETLLSCFKITGIRSWILWIEVRALVVKMTKEGGDS